VGDTTDTAPTYAADIRPLFREADRDAMVGVFDLWEYEDVKGNADRILERLEDGTMPCDGGWPDDDVSRFAAWIRGGMQL
jgi:hypothetical protein